VTLRAAILGIDGSGKSLLVEHLRAVGSSRSTLIAFNCPDFHHTPNAPLAALSAHLKALSDLADDLGSVSLKLTALCLRMTLYGPVERFFRETYCPACLISDRHPIIDTLVYLPLYRQRLSTAAIDGLVDVHAVREQLDAREPGAYEAICAWHRSESRRLGREAGLDSLGVELVQSLTGPLEDRIEALALRYRTTLPDVVVLLDVSIEEALRRSELRGRRELHEERHGLTSLRDSYERVLGQLSALGPGIEVHRISNAGGSPDATVEKLLGALGVEGRPRAQPSTG
jgi:hypothetical protein